jgi:hypothetical protein
MSLEFVVRLGSVGSDRRGIKAARNIMRRIERRGSEATQVHPLEKELPLHGTLDQTRAGILRTMRPDGA